MEARRWALESGPGGDHDQPYTFAMPQSLETVAAWLHLLGRRWRERASTIASTSAPADEVGVRASVPVRAAQ
jgi:hypothetical protein